MVDCLKAGNTLTEATDQALLKFSESLDDADDGPLIWLGIAHTQWKYGLVAESVLRRVRADVTSQRGLERWREDAPLLRKRLEVLSRFLEKLESPNPRPAAIPRQVVRLAPYAPGDCLSVLTASLKYTAAIVLDVDNSNVELGSNLVGSLDFLSNTPPTQADFEKRNWLVKHHGNWNGERELIWLGPNGFKQEASRFDVICKTRIRFFDPKKSRFHGAWASLGAQVLHCRAANEA
jgi:hypothetical protein